MILKLKPIFIEKIWGGNRFHQENIGECWGISGHKSNSNEVETSSIYEGLTLRELFLNHKELFGNYPSDEFPILVKLIDSKENLSIQVHPDDEYARTVENSQGKEECWYILNTKADTKILIGNSFDSKEELKQSINDDTILDYIKEYDIKSGDYFYIPAGTVHAICKDTYLLEVSQSSNITYRLYDYNRLDNGKLRELHIDKASDVIKVPDIDLIKEHQNKYFTFEVIDNTGSHSSLADQYGDYISILEGEGYLGNFKVHAGEFYMVSSKSDYRIEGKMKYHRSRLL
jgi:mannose-6-phosphate isomerase